MKNIYDFSGFDGSLASLPIKYNSDIPDQVSLEITLKNKLKESCEKGSVSFREHFFFIPISGHDLDAFAFAFLDCFIAIHVKRIYSTKNWKPKEDIYTVAGYKIKYASRKSVYDDFSISEVKKNINSYSDIEESYD